MAALGAAAASTTALITASPAFAGGGAGMTLTASMSGQKGVLPFGSPHTVWIQVTDSPLGEATLEHVTVTVSGAAAPVVCDRGPNGTVILVPGRTVECSTQIAAGAGSQSLIVQATGMVAGSESTLVRTVVVSYQGAVPTPGSGAPSSAAHFAGCGSSATSTVNGSGCVVSDKPSMACTPGPSVGTGPVSAGGPGCAPVLPSASPAADCAARGVGPVTLGSEDCAKAKGWGALALTGTRIMGWGAVAVTAVVAGAVLMLRHRRSVKGVDG